ncbi:putative transmembrane protein [Rosa chinensis]|uniref:Putative transmembrane protein n=1 Tax=Rosa chinensis TaxID=74649 RepID=A0A2P6QUZ2_ROSCH|nr:putative transmembrane protein [Rosa chinensis]
MLPDGDVCTYCASENGGSNGDNAEGLVCAHYRKSDPSQSSFCYSSSLKYVPVPSSDSEKLQRVMTASIKGFTIGAGLKGGLAVFSILARLRKRKLLASLRTEGAITNNEAIVTVLQETLRYGLFLGTFAGTFVSVDEIIASLGGHRRHFRTAKWRALLAGLIAGLSMLLTGHNTQHTSLAVYILMRATVPLTWKHDDIFLMCLSSSQILRRRISLSLPPSLQQVAHDACSRHLGAETRRRALRGQARRQANGPCRLEAWRRRAPKFFLNKHGGKDITILQGVKEIASGLPFTNLEAIER